MCIRDRFQADQLEVPVTVPEVSETTALGAAYAAGLAVGFYQDLEELKSLWQEEKTYFPAGDPQEREVAYAKWKRAVERTFDWFDG